MNVDFQAEFPKLVDESHLENRRLADIFCVSVPTIIRWKRGESIPTELVQKSVLSFLHSYIKLRNDVISRDSSVEERPTSI